MRFSIWQGFLTVFILVTIVVLLQQSEETLDAATHTSQIGDSDLSMEQAYTRQFDKDGLLRYILAATKSVWHSQQSSADFQHPELAIFAPNEQIPLWTAKANQGQVIMQSVQTTEPAEKPSDTQEDTFDLSFFGLNADDLPANDPTEEIAQITLQGDVVLIQDHDPYFKLSSEALTIMPMEKHVIGKGVVELQFIGNTTSGYDLEANLTASHYSLGSLGRTRVQSVYTFDAVHSDG